MDTSATHDIVPTVPPSPLTAAQTEWARIADKIRADMRANDKAQWITDACTVLSRITGDIYADGVHAGYSLSVIDVQTHDGVDPSTRRSNYRPPSGPRVDHVGQWLWHTLCDTLWSYRVVIHPKLRASVKPNSPQRVRRYLDALSTTAQYWHTSPRAADLDPVFTDLAYKLKALCEGPLAGYLSPITAERTCSQAPFDPRCRVTPVYARGMCRRCYDHRRHADKHPCPSKHKTPRVEQPNPCRSQARQGHTASSQK